MPIAKTRGMGLQTPIPAEVRLTIFWQYLLLIIAIYSRHLHIYQVFAETNSLNPTLCILKY